MKFPGSIALAVAVMAAPLAAQQPPAPLPAEAAKAPKDTAKAKPIPKIDISKLKFMSGCWAGQVDKDQTVEEIWTMPSENLLLSTTRYFKKGRAQSYDFNRIEVTDSGVVFGITAKGKPEETYLMKTLVDEYALFENPAKKEFPQRIMYRLASDGALIPRNEGDGPSFELRFHRIKCPGADIKLRP